MADHDPATRRLFGVDIIVANSVAGNHLEIGKCRHHVGFNAVVAVGQNVLNPGPILREPGGEIRLIAGLVDCKRFLETGIHLRCRSPNLKEIRHLDRPLGAGDQGLRSQAP